MISLAAVISLIFVLPENSASILPSREIIVQILVCVYLSSKPLIFISLIANKSIPPLTSVWLKVNLLSAAPILSLAINEIEVPCTFASAASVAAFNNEADLPFSS